MKRRHYIAVRFIVSALAVLSLLGTAAYAQTTFSGTGDWSNSGNWNNGVPTSGVDAIIANGATCTVDVPAECASLTIATGNASTTVTISGSNSLTVGGAITINVPSLDDTTKSIDVGSGTLVAASLSMGNPSNNTRICSLSIGDDGTVTIFGNITMSGSNTENYITWTGNGILYLGGDLVGTTGNLNTAGNGTVVYNGSGAQSIAGTRTYNHLTIANTSSTDSVTLIAATTVNGDFTISDGTLSAANTLAVTGTTSISGRLRIHSTPGTKTATDVTVNANGAIFFGAAETYAISGNLNMDNSAAISGNATGTMTVGGSLNITGTGVDIGTATLTVSGTTNVSGEVDFSSATGTKIFIDSITIFSGGSWSSSGNSAFTLRNGIHHAGVSFSSGTGIYTLATTDSQRIAGTSPLTFDRLTITGVAAIHANTHASGLTVTTALAGNGGLTMTENILLTLHGTSAITTLDCTTNTPNTVIYAGTGAQTTKTTTYYNLEVDGDNSVKTLNTGTTIVNNQLTVTAGTLNLANRSITVDGSVILNDSMTNTGTGTKNFGSVIINASGTFSNSATVTFNVQGDWTNNGGTFTPSTGTINFNGTGAQEINGTEASQTFYNLIINKSSGAVSVGGSTTEITVNAFTQTLGNFNAPATMIIAAAATFTAGTFSAGDNLNIAGNWSAATGSVFTAGTGTVAFNGTAAQQITGTLAEKIFNNVIVNKPVGIGVTSAGGTTTVTLNGTYEQIQGNFTTPATLNVTGIATLTDGILSISAAGTKTFTTHLNVNSTSILTIANNTAIVNIGGNLNVNGNGTINGTNSGTINVTGDLNMDGSSSIAGTGNKAINIDEDLNIIGGSVTIGASTIVVSGSTNVTGTVDFNSATGTKTLTGAVQISGSGSWASSANETFTLQGGLTHNGASFNSGTGVYIFDALTPQSIAGTSTLTIANVTVASGIVSNNVTHIDGLTISTALSGAGELVNPANALLNLGGTLGITATLTAVAVPNTVNYNRNNTQTINATIYHHLILSNTSAKTAGGNLTVNGNLTVEGTATFNQGSNLTHNFYGNWIVNTTAVTPFDATNNTVVNFNEPTPSAPTSISGTATGAGDFRNINLNNTAGFTSSINFDTELTLTVSSGVTFTPDAGVQINPAGNAGTITGNGTVIVTRIAAINDYSMQYRFTTNTLTNLLVEYAGAAAQQASAITYGAVRINNASGVTVNGTVNTSSITIGSGALNVSTGGTVNTTGSITINSSGVLNVESGRAVTISADLIHNGIISNEGTINVGP